eukprot:1825039-Amphidinium_carterae.2
MEELGLGPNGALVYAMEYIEVNLDWLFLKLRKVADAVSTPYIILDCPGQVELYTHHDVMTRITQQLVKGLDFRLTAVHLVDSTLCVDAFRYISAVMLSLAAMMQMELPHVNVLSKVDLLVEHADELALNVSYYTGADALSHLLRTLQSTQHPLSIKFREFNALLAELVEDYGLVTFEPLDIQDKECALRVLARCDQANGHLLGAEKIEDPSDPISNLRLFQAGIRDPGESMEEYFDRYRNRHSEAEAERAAYGADDILHSMS